MKKLNLGAHMSIAGGVHTALQRGKKIGCDTIQLFVKNNKSWAAPSLTEEDIETFATLRDSSSIAPLVCHAGYLINLASPEAERLQQSREAMLDEMQRCEALGLDYIVVHPGSHKKTGEEEGLKRVAESLDWLHERTAGFKLQILLETTAGQGSNLGYTFEQLERMIALSADADRLGVCLDTCHIFAAGYDLRSEEKYNQTMDDFAATVGMDRLKVLHINDSQNDLNTRKDRHDHIGSGFIGLEGFRNLVNDERMQEKALILETPKGPDSAEDVENMMVLRGLVQRG